MVGISRPSLQIDLNEFKLHLHLKGRTQLTLYFNSPSRRFYLSVIALVVKEMRKSGKIKSIPLHEHLDLLALLNESVGGAAGSSDKENLLPRIYRKWKNGLPNLEEAPLFKVLGKKKEEEEGAIGRVYSFTDVEKEGWANLFDYLGSEENVRLKFAVDRIGVGLNETSIIFGDSLNADAWEQFISSLKNGNQEKSELVEETLSPEAPAVPSSFPQERKMRYPLPDKPSIAVLPFMNMSEDLKQEFFCDGLTEEIITSLTKVRDLFVISRQSIFTYKGKPVKVEQVSEELGVRYVLEGSVRGSGDRVRITVQLIDALRGNLLWAEGYDRDLKDIFVLQDEITMKILTATQVELTLGEQASRVEKFFKGKQGLDCYLKYLEGSKYNHGHNIDDNRVARRIAEEAISMSPENPAGYVLLAWVHWMEYWLGSGRSPQESIGKGMEMVQKALAIDDFLARAHALLGNFYALKREHDKAIAEGERAIALDPGEAEVQLWYAMSLNYVGRSEEAILLYQKAIRLNPFAATGYFLNFAATLRDAKRFEEAASQ